MLIIYEKKGIKQDGHYASCRWDSDIKRYVPVPYCKDCHHLMQITKRGHVINIDDSLEDQFVGYEYTCLKCGSKTDSNFPCKVNHATKGVYFHEDTGNLVLFMPSLYVETYKNKKRLDSWFVEKMNKVKISFNVHTGRTLICEIYEKKQRLIRNATFGFHEIPFASIGDKEDAALYVAFANALFKTNNLPVVAKSEVYKDDFKTRECYICIGDKKIEFKYGDEFLNFALLIARAPNIYLSYDKYTGKCNLRRHAEKWITERWNYEAELDFFKDITPYAPCDLKFRKLQPMNLMDEADYINYMCDIVDAPKSKRFMKEYRRNPMLIGSAAYFRSAGIKELDNIYSLFELLKKFNTSRVLLRAETPFLKRFLRDAVACQGENLTVKKLCSTKNVEDLLDAVKGYHTLRYNKVEKLPSFKGKNLKEFHDEIFFQIQDQELYEDNRKISYSDKEKELEMEEDKYKVLLPQNTNKLMAIGNAMNICVGHCYSDSAVNKKCTIVYIVDPEGKYSCCMELRGKKVVQIKAKYNNAVVGKTAQVVQSWITKKHLLVDADNWDYQQMKATIA